MVQNTVDSILQENLYKTMSAKDDQNGYRENDNPETEEYYQKL